MTKRYSLGDLKELIRYSPNDDEGQTYVGRDYVVSTGCSPFFVSELEEHGSMCMQFVRMGVVKSGSCEPVVHSAQYLCREGDLFFAGWGTELTEDAVSPGTFFEGILMTEEYLKKIFGAYLPQVFLSPCQHFMLHLSEAEQDMWHDYLRILYTLAIHESFDRKPLNALFISVFRFVQALYESQGERAHENLSRSRQLAESFIQLVNEYAREHHEVSFYASRLCVTPHYLGLVVKDETEETAREWIDKTITIGIQVELRYSNKSLKELADRFHFASSSSLCKFFKRRMGCTPNEYRRNKEV